MVKYWRKEILLAVTLLALFAAAVSVGTVADVQEGRVDELLQKVEQLETQVEKMEKRVDKNDGIVNRWLEVGSWSG